MADLLNCAQFNNVKYNNLRSSKYTKDIIIAVSNKGSTGESFPRNKQSLLYDYSIRERNVRMSSLAVSPD